MKSSSSGDDFPFLPLGRQSWGGVGLIPWTREGVVYLSSWDLAFSRESQVFTMPSLPPTSQSRSWLKPELGTKTVEHPFCFPEAFWLAFWTSHPMQLQDLVTVLRGTTVHWNSSSPQFYLSWTVPWDHQKLCWLLSAEQQCSIWAKPGFPVLCQHSEPEMPPGIQELENISTVPHSSPLPDITALLSSHCFKTSQMPLHRMIFFNIFYRDFLVSGMISCFNHTQRQKYLLYIFQSALITI